MAAPSLLPRSSAQPVFVRDDQMRPGLDFGIFHEAVELARLGRGQKPQEQDFPWRMAPQELVKECGQWWGVGGWLEVEVHDQVTAPVVLDEGATWALHELSRPHA